MAENSESFRDMGLDPGLINGLMEKQIQNPTLIQRFAIPLILEGKDVVARAKTGSGKTMAYLLVLLHNSNSSNFPNSFAVVLAPTTDLVEHVYSDLMELSGVHLRVAQLSSFMSETDLKQPLSGPPNVLVSTPAQLHDCLSSRLLQPKAIQDSLSMLILDEADLFLPFGYKDDLTAFASHVPRTCQCLVMTPTSGDNVDKLKKLILHNPYLLTLPEDDGGKDDLISNSVDQFWISCGDPDKFLYVLALLKLDLIQKKVLLFTNTIDMGFRLKLFLEKFSIRAAVLNDEIPQNSRLHVCEEFNAGLFDYLIATDDGKIYTKEQEVAGNDDAEMKESKKQWNQNLDAESGVVRDIDFKNVHTVINVQMPSTAAGYIHRIGRTGRACNTGSSVCLVSQEEMEAFEELKSTLAEHTSGVDLIAPFPLPLGNAVELLRYRTEASTLVKCSSSQSKRVREEIDDGGESAAILKSVKQYWISCDAREKFTHIIAFLKKNLVPKKVLLFTASINLGYKLKLFLKKFAIKAAVLNPDLTQTMRVHTVSEFNAGSFDYLIAIHDGGAVTLEPEASGENASDRFNTQWKQTLNDRFGVVIGTELKDVSTVIHFDMPRTAAGYIHRIGRTGRESNPRASVCLVSPDEMETFEEVKSKLAAYRSEKEEFIVPFGSFEPYGVDILRFQARAIERTVTVADVRNAIAQNSH